MARFTRAYERTRRDILRSTLTASRQPPRALSPNKLIEGLKWLPYPARQAEVFVPFKTHFEIWSGGYRMAKVQAPNFTPAGIKRAFTKALKRVQDDGLLASTHSIGFVMEPGKKGDRMGYQLFVKVARYSEHLLAIQPMSGGLLELARDVRGRRIKA